MPLISSYWTVQGISPEARDAAVRAAKAEGEELGEWLSRLIGNVNASELDAAANREATKDTMDNAEDPADETDDKLSSIERAMIQSR
jgi:ABC-type transporter Mla subunit MlaD